LEKQSLKQRIKEVIIGVARNPKDKKIFQRISLIAFFAWIGLGADGLSSSCYGPQEAFLALKGHPYLSIFVALATVATIFIISSSYSQIVELFPYGGGGYLVASKLLSPTLGMISGCALLIDYVLTIAVSIAAGTDALFSLLPIKWHLYKLTFAICVVLGLMFLNMRGVKESILVLMPIFLTFIFTHVFIITYIFFQNVFFLPDVITSIKLDVNRTTSQMGFFGMLFLILHAYTMGAGTYTGLEVVSNGISILREPKTKTAKDTMRYMAISLAFVVIGLMIAYIFYNVKPITGKTLNAVVFEHATQSWRANISHIFIAISLISECTLLFVAAQTGFVGGPSVLANMSVDKWFPTRFSLLSDRLVTQNGILIMSALAIVLMALTSGSVYLLVILYSINVFISFSLSQFGMIKHWWNFRKKVKSWRNKLFINGIGFLLTSFILITMLVFKFNEGGWITLIITGGLVGLAILIKRHYYSVSLLLRRLDSLVKAVEASEQNILPDKKGITFNPKDKTAVLVVNGFNGIGLHTLFGILRLFPGLFKNFIFVEVGIVDAGNFKGIYEIKNLERQVKSDINRYISYMKKEGYYAEGIPIIGTDVAEEVEKIAPLILKRFPNVMFFGGQLIFPNDSLALRMLHNYTVFTLQKRLYLQGISFVILPIRVQ